LDGNLLIVDITGIVRILSTLCDPPFIISEMIGMARLAAAATADFECASKLFS
jgi:hypothetical protein